MTQLSQTDLQNMERRYRKMERDAAVRNYRRTKVKSVRPMSPSQRNAEMVAAIKAGEALARAKTPPAPAADESQKEHVLMTLDLGEDVPFKTASVVMSLGATIGDRVVLNYLDPAMAAELPAVVIPTAKLGSAQFLVYPSLASANAAEAKANEALNAFRASKA